MKRWYLSLAALAALGFIASPAIAAKDGQSAAETKSAMTAEIGQPAPTFSLADYSGKSHNLADNKGKISVLIWHNPDCPFVVRHLKADSYNKLRTQFPADQVDILLIDSSNYVTAEKAKSSAEENKLNVPVALDADGTVGKQYGAKTTPHVYVIDKAGNLAYAGAIDNDPQGDKPAGEVENYTADAVAALLAGQPVKTSSTKPYGCSVKYAAKDAAALSDAIEYQLAGKDCCPKGGKTTQTMILAGKDCCPKGGKTTQTMILAGKDCCPKGGKTTATMTLACGTACDKGKDKDKKEGTSRLEEMILACGTACDKGKDKDKKEGTSRLEEIILACGTACDKGKDKDKKEGTSRV